MMTSSFMASLVIIGFVQFAFMHLGSASGIPNGSFETPGSVGPAEWTFKGSNDALPGAWTHEEPYSGNRALRIDARHGSQQWETVTIPVQGGQKYLLGWQTRFHGEKSWRFRAEFCGAEVSFKDKQGRTIKTERQHTSCWQTRGWQPGWFLFSVPAEANTANVRFAIRTTKPLPGGFDVDNVEMSEWPPRSIGGKSNLHLLQLRVEDETGQLLAARIRIADENGKAIRPPGAIAYEQAGGAFHSLEEGKCYAFLPSGRYSITVTKGFEYEPWESEVEVRQKRQGVTVRLRRLWDWRQRGWFNGDHHTHLFRHGGSLFPTLRWPDVMRAARCEGLDFLPFMGADRYPREGKRSNADEQWPDFSYELTEEITEDFWGHVCPIGVSAEARRDERYDQGPMHADRFAALDRSGGVLSYGHPYGPLSRGDDLEPVAKRGMGHVAREFPVDLALGIPCAMDLLAMEGPFNQLERKLHDLYRLWNLGFRPVVGASTDFHIDQGRQPIGSVRTYVRSGGLDMASIGAGYRAGHTFATSGPLIDLRVGAVGPGDEVRFLTVGQKVHVEVTAVSIGELDRVEILVNGKLSQTITSAMPHQIIGAYDVGNDQSFWIAARAYGRGDRHLASQLEGKPIGAGQFAHTTPVYVLVGGRPIFAAEKGDAEYFVRWCDAVRTAWGRHDAVIDERLNRARNVFTELANRQK